MQSAGVEYQDLQSDYCLFAWLSFRPFGANRNSVFCRQGFTPPAYHLSSLRDFACRNWRVRCCHRSRPSVGHDLRLIKCRPFGTWPAGHKFRVALRHCERSEAVHICFRLMKICFPFLRDAKYCVSTQLRPLSHILPFQFVEKQLIIVTSNFGLSYTAKLDIIHYKPIIYTYPLPIEIPIHFGYIPRRNYSLKCRKYALANPC